MPLTRSSPLASDRSGRRRPTTDRRRGTEPVACSPVTVETATEAWAGHGLGTGMSRARKLANLAGTVLPLVGLVVAIALLWDRMVGPRELVILLVGYVVAGIGITVGYHRLFTHRSFQTYRWVRYAFAISG